MSTEIVQRTKCVKGTFENPSGNVEKLSPKESVKGADNVLRGSVRAPMGFSKGKPEAPKLRWCSPQCFAAKGFQQLLRLPKS